MKMKVNKYQQFYVDSTLKALEEQYKEVDKKLHNLYIKYAKDRERLLDEVSRVILDYKVIEEKLDLTAKEKRLIGKKMQTSIYDIVLEESKHTKESIKAILRDSVNNTYKYQEHLLSLGIDFKSIPLQKKVIDRIVNNTLAGDVWSNRLWKNKKALETVLNREIKKFIKGEININDISKVVKNRFKSDRYATDRLVRTELARCQQETINRFDEEHNCEYQLFIATLDGKTSDICQQYDGVAFSLNDSSKPIPPLHPNCRSVLTMIPSEDYRPKTRRNNETNEIEGYKTYSEWIK